MRHQTKISNLLKVEDLRNEISNLITNSKEKYYQHINPKLNDPLLSNKIYSSILKTFYNRKKVPVILPFFINNKFVTDFEKKANILNSFLQSNARRFQAVVSWLQKYDIWRKDRIKTICFGKSDVVKLIKALGISKGHGHDGPSVKMIKICADPIAHLRTLIFQNALAAGIFANDWKNANILRIHTKKW